jgi:hypothetical protein
MKQVVFPNQGASPERKIQNISSDTTVDLRQNHSEPRDIFNYKPVSHNLPTGRASVQPARHSLNPNSQIQDTRYKTSNTNLTFSSTHKLPFENQRPQNHINSQPARSNSGEFNRSGISSHNFTPAPSIPVQTNIPKPAPIQVAQPQSTEQKSSDPQPLIISPRRRYSKPIPDYNVVNLKK